MGDVILSILVILADHALATETVNASVHASHG